MQTPCLSEASRAKPPCALAGLLGVPVSLWAPVSWPNSKDLLKCLPPNHTTKVSTTSAFAHHPNETGVGNPVGLCLARPSRLLTSVGGLPEP